MTSNFAGMGGHHSAASKTSEWYTPPEAYRPILDVRGGLYGLDPSAPMRWPSPLKPIARRQYTKADNGLMRPWQLDEDEKTSIWLNPPYDTDSLTAFMGRMAEHNCGMALIFARTETQTFVRYGFQRASAMLFIAGRLNFYKEDGTQAERNSGAPSVMLAYGDVDRDVLAEVVAPAEYDGNSVIWPEGKIPGEFIPLIFPRGVLVEAFQSETWRQLVSKTMAGTDGPIRLTELYDRLADHPKAKGNPNYQAKVRQQLQQGPYERVAPGLWDRMQ